MTFPMQTTSQPAQQTGASNPANRPDRFDMRAHLAPRRLTLAMWDQAFLLRHVPGGSFEDYDRVLDEAIERGYNTLRLDPLPQLLDLQHPERVFDWPEPHTPYMPWCWNSAVSGPVGAWLIEFMEKLLARGLHYTLSAWWFTGQSGNNPFPAESLSPASHLEAAGVWARLLRDWERRFGWQGLVYIDLANEVPYFLPGFMERFMTATGVEWGAPTRFDATQAGFLAQELNPALGALRQEFPALRFTASIHGDPRWLDVPVEFDCLDVHFYADADPRWSQRTRFGEHMTELFTSADWHTDFSTRCQQTHQAVAPMLRARQRSKLAAFAAWSQERGMPLTTSESWATWYYYDSPHLDWAWLLEWASWSVEDALDYQMWGWTPHNYCQPQFKNWADVAWHRKLTERFLNSI